MAKVIHERFKCIGCGACAVVCEKYWKMADDGLSDLIGGELRKTDDGEVFEREIPEEDVECNKEAGEMCPVNCIHVEKDGKRLI